MAAWTPRWTQAATPPPSTHRRPSAHLVVAQPRSAAPLVQRPSASTCATIQTTAASAASTVCARTVATDARRTAAPAAALSSGAAACARIFAARRGMRSGYRIVQTCWLTAQTAEAATYGAILSKLTGVVAGSAGAVRGATRAPAPRSRAAVRWGSMWPAWTPPPTASTADCATTSAAPASAVRTRCAPLARSARPVVISVRCAVTAPVVHATPVAPAPAASPGFPTRECPTRECPTRG